MQSMLSYLLRAGETVKEANKKITKTVTEGALKVKGKASKSVN